MATPKQSLDQQQSQLMRVKNSGLISYNGSPIEDNDEEEMSKSALAAFRAKEEEIKRKKMEIRERVQAQLGRVEVETKRLAEIREVSLDHILNTNFFSMFSVCLFVFFKKDKSVNLYIKFGSSFMSRVWIIMIKIK